MLKTNKASAANGEGRTMTTRRCRVVLAALSLLLGPGAGAGLLDRRTPTLNGGPAQVVYRMGPIYYHPGRADTIVTCTNLEDMQVNAAIELFDQGDNPVGTLTQATLGVGGTINFVTSADSGTDSRVVIQGIPPLDHGKARVSATTTKLTCTAYHRIRAADGIIQESALELVKKVGLTARPAGPGSRPRE